MSSRFDELSKAMASGMPRRTVLKLFAASLLASIATPFTRLTAHAGTAVCSPPCQPGQQCVSINGGVGVCVGGVVCSPPCTVGQVCIAINGTHGICIASPCNPPCGPGEACVSFSGNRHICVSRHCNPPCRGNQICVAMNGTPFCMDRP